THAQAETNCRFKIGNRHHEPAIAGAEHRELAGICDSQTNGGRESKSDRLERMTEARRLGIGNAQIAGNPTTEMPGVRSDYAIPGQNIVQRLAECPRINVLRARLIRIRAVMIVARPDALTRAIVAAA